MVSYETKPIEAFSVDRLPGKKMAVRGRNAADVEPCRRPPGWCCVVGVVARSKGTGEPRAITRTPIDAKAVRVGRQQTGDMSAPITAGQLGTSCGKEGFQSSKVKLAL